MKIVVVLLTVVCLQASANGYSQERITLSMKDASFKEVLTQIQKQTSYRFIYHDNVELRKKGAVNIDVENVTLGYVMNALLRNSGFTYSDLGNGLMAISAAGKQDRPITGTVTNSKGEALAGVSIQLKGSPVGTITDANGQFSMNVPEDAVLVLSAVGYIAKEVPVGTGNNINVLLEVQETRMDEVVVVAYGTESRQTQTSAVSSIKASAIRNIPSAQLSTSLAGRLPGAVIIQNSGFVGANASIAVRGSRTAALYVVDNVVTDKAQFDVLDPGEIESISILKDAAAAAIYGARASGGVVVVKTRSGKKGKTAFHYQGMLSTSRTMYPLQNWTPEQELIFRNGVATTQNRLSASPNPDFKVPFNQEALDYAKTMHPQSINDILWRNPSSQQHSIDASGGSDHVSYFFSANYSGNKGSYDNTNFDKYTLRAKVDAQVSKNLKIGTNLSYNRRYTDRFYWPYDGDNGEGFTVADFYRPTFNLSRLYPFYSKADGTPTTAEDPDSYATIQPGWGFNPAQTVNSVNYRHILYNTFNATVTGELKIPQIKGLSLKVLGNYRQDNYFRKDFVGEFNVSYRVQPAGASGIDLLKLNPLKFDAANTVVNNYGKSFTGIDEYMFMDERYQTNGFLDYTRSFGMHNISAFAGFEQYQFMRKAVNGTAQDLLTSGIDQILVANTDAARRNFGGSELNQSRLSYFGRAKYDYDARYIAEFSFREDGSYIFPQGKQFGFFPSVSAGWVVSKERFFAVKPISTLKLRASYGTTGYDGVDGIITNIAPYQFQNNYSVNNGYLFAGGNMPGLAPQSVLPNPGITWQINKTINGGIDVGFLKDALSMSFDYFVTNKSKVLASTVDLIPGTLGTGLPTTNIGELRSNGFELVLGYGNTRGDFSYNVGFNISYAIEKYISWPQLSTLADFQKRIGRPTDGIVTGYISEGIVKDQSVIDALPAGYKQFGRPVILGSVLLKDINGAGYAPGPDGKVDNNDVTILSTNSVPRTTFGIPVDLRWRNFSLNMLFQGVGKYDKFVRTINGIGAFQQADRPYFDLWTDAYSPDLNPDGKYPMASGSFSDPDLMGGSSSFWMRNGAYGRLKNATLAYSLPEKLISKAGLTGVQLSFNATNLFTISKFKEYDPEQSSLDSYPLFRSYAFGLNISL
ncbi:SusC/RagA family TonB-linked outer membrane protein [Niabella aurantiaca]|uniref:SusC/RagA family TonB-linked outer membrane protein n=1 Tax=Niabella aurantiaca TaxID=379900 RepID=UPI00037B6068|nr:SusC/RagA family TonB-linked outer membrane protein [Niabella aurantiaca]